MNQRVLSTILPFSIAACHFNYAEVATLVLASTVVSSIMQPVFGNLIDKASRPWMMVTGVLLAGGGVTAAGSLSDFRLLLVSIMISGVGVTAFCPENTRMANRVSDEKKGTGASILSFGGSIGLTVESVLATVSISLFRLKGTTILAVPCVLMAITILPQIKKMNQAPSEQGSSEIILEKPTEPDRWTPFTLLNLLSFGRSIVFRGLNTFPPFLFIQILRQSEPMDNTLLSFYFIIGAASTLISGRLGDCFGFIEVTRTGFTLLPLVLTALVTVHAIMPVVLFLIPVVYVLYPPSGLTVVLGQRYLPNRMGLAPGITLDLSVSIGEMVAPFLRHLAGKFGLMVAIYAITAISTIPMVMSYTLSKEGKEEEAAQNSYS